MTTTDRQLNPHTEIKILIFNLHNGLTHKNMRIFNLHNNGLTHQNVQIFNLHNGLTHKNVQIFNLHNGLTHKNVQNNLHNVP